MKKRRRRFSPATYAEIIGRQAGRCACGCGEPLGVDPREIEFDHFISLGLGGVDEPDNMRAVKRGKGHHLDKTIRETKQRAKFARIAERDGLRKPRMNARDKLLAKMLQREGT